MEIGEIKKLSRMASPEIGIITDLGLAHMNILKIWNNLLMKKQNY